MTLGRCPPLNIFCSRGALPRDPESIIYGWLQVILQGYLAHKKMSSPRTLQAYAYGPRAVVGGGVRVLMSEIPLYGDRGRRPSAARATT